MLWTTSVEFTIPTITKDGWMIVGKLKVSLEHLPQNIPLQMSLQ